MHEHETHQRRRNGFGNIRTPQSSSPCGSKLVAVAVGSCLCCSAACSFERTFGEEYTFAAAYSVRQTPSGGYVLAGSAYESATTWDMYLVRTAD